MYVPDAFAEHDAQRLRAFIREHGFATVVTHRGEDVQISHIPVLLEADGTALLGHVAAANPQARHLRDGARCICVFQGPHAYISPTWYQRPGVPTWNYAAVHAAGQVQPVTDKERLRELVERLTEKYEQGRAEPWQPTYPERMLEAIVGFRLPIQTLEGKFKLSQNRPAVDRRGVVEALERSGTGEEQALADLMRERSFSRD